jgi:hypothetical protein
MCEGKNSFVHFCLTLLLLVSCITPPPARRRAAALRHSEQPPSPGALATVRVRLGLATESARDQESASGGDSVAAAPSLGLEVYAVAARRARAGLGVHQPCLNRRPRPLAPASGWPGPLPVCAAGGPGL